MSLLYPHRIRIMRPGAAERTLGANAYSGEHRHRGETCIAEDIEAAIQFKKEAQKPEGQLPADTVRRTLWQVMIPRGALPEEVTIQQWDVIEDKAHSRYQVIAAYLTGLGYQLMTELLQV